MRIPSRLSVIAADRPVPATPESPKICFDVDGGEHSCGSAETERRGIPGVGFGRAVRAYDGRVWPLDVLDVQIANA